MTDTLLRASLQSGVALLVIAVICRLFSRLSANTRCWLWRLGYVKCLATFVFSTAIAIPVLPTQSHVSVRESQFLASEITLPAVKSLPPAVKSLPPAAKSLPPAAEALPPVDEALLPAAKSLPPAAFSGSGTAKWASGIAVVYFLGAGLALLRLVIATAQTALLLRHAMPARLPLAGELTKHFGLRKAPRIARLSDFSSPLLAFNTVLLPEPALADEHLIFAHELAHVKRRDLLWEAIGAIVQTFFWFHPLVWYARREEKLAREQAADALALAVTNAPRADYARVLLTATLRHTPALAVGAFASPSRLRHRLEALAQPALPRRKAAALLALASTLIVPALIPWRAVARQATVAPPPPLAPQQIFPDGVTVQGQLTDGLTHKPMPNVLVRAFTKDKPIRSRGIEIPQDREVNTTRTDSEGRYSLSLPAKTVCRITISVSMPVPGKEGWSVDGASRRYYEQSSRTVSGDKGQVVTADLVTIPPQPVTGVVVDAKNIPVTDAELTLLSGSPGPYKTDSNGNFSIPEDRLSLGINQGGYGYRDHKTGKFITTNLREERKTIRLRAIRGEEFAEIEVPASSLEPLTLRLEKGKLVKVFGRVVDDLGRAVSGVAISGVSCLNVHPHDTRWLKTTTDATGAFTFFVTPGQVFYFSCTKLGYGSVGYNPGVAAILGKPHNAGKLVLARANATVGGVVLKPTGAPAPQVAVEILGQRDHYHIYTDSNGRFQQPVVAEKGLTVYVISYKDHLHYSGKLTTNKRDHVLQLVPQKRSPFIR